MARYIKANPKVAAFLGLTRDRNTVKDGNYLLLQADMLAFGPLTQLQETLTQIGGLALLAHEAREEQDGTVTRPLPTPTDPRFIIDAGAQEETPENVQTGSKTAQLRQKCDEKLSVLSHLFSLSLLDFPGGQSDVCVTPRGKAPRKAEVWWGSHRSRRGKAPSVRR